MSLPLERDQMQQLHQQNQLQMQLQQQQQQMQQEQQRSTPMADQQQITQVVTGDGQHLEDRGVKRKADDMATGENTQS